MTAEDLEISTLFGGHRPPLQGFRCVLVFCRPYGAVFVLPAPPRLTPWAKALSLASRAGFPRSGLRRSTRCPPSAPVHRSLRARVSRVAASENPTVSAVGPSSSLASRAVLAAERRQHI